MVSIAATLDTVLVAASDGVLAGDVRPLVRLNVQVIAEADGRREQGSAGGGGRYGYDRLLAGDDAREFAREAVRQALVNLEAVPAPAGSMTVVLGPGWPGVLLHEAVGHGLEGDFNRKGTVGLQRPHRRARGGAGRDRGRRRHPGRAARLAQRRRRGHADPVHGADRGRRSCAATCRTG